MAGCWEMCEVLGVIDRRQEASMMTAVLHKKFYWVKEDCEKEGELLEWTSLLGFSIDHSQSGMVPLEGAVRAGEIRQIHHVVRTDLV